jgi:hypothetical protein
MLKGRAQNLSRECAGRVVGLAACIGELVSRCAGNDWKKSEFGQILGLSLAFSIIL